MMTERPYFLNDKEWFYFDEDKCCYGLTDKATEKAKESYKEFYNLLESMGKYDV